MEVRQAFLLFSIPWMNVENQILVKFIVFKTERLETALLVPYFALICKDRVVQFTHP